MEKVLNLPRNKSFSLCVIRLMEEEDQKELQRLQKMESERYEKRRKDWPEFKARLCPKCEQECLKKYFTPHPLYGGRHDFKCKNCKYEEVI